jgi:hypothetical protein
VVHLDLVQGSILAAGARRLSDFGSEREQATLSAVWVWSVWFRHRALMSWKGQILFDLCMTTSPFGRSVAALTFLRLPLSSGGTSLPLKRERMATAKRCLPIMPSHVVSFESIRVSIDFENTQARLVKMSLRHGLRQAKRWRSYRMRARSIF